MQDNNTNRMGQVQKEKYILHQLLTQLASLQSLMLLEKQIIP